MEPSNQTVLILFVFLTGLILLLVFFYKKLNKEAEGEYTIRRFVYKEGGVRDQARGAAVALGTCLGVQLWPGGDADEDGEEMQEVRDVEGGSSSQSDTEGSEEEREEEEEEEEEEGSREAGKAGDSSDDKSTMADSEDEEEEEQAKLKDDEEVEKKEAKQDAAGGEQVKVEAGGGTGLLIDLHQFSGSAIWSEEEGKVDVCEDVTAL